MKDTVLIIGASSDIGIELIKSLDGESLILAHYHKCNKKLMHLAKSIRSELVMIKADLSIEDEVLSMVNEIEKNFSVPNKIIHLAAPKFKYIRFQDFHWSDFQYSIDVSLKSLIIILNRFLPELAKEKKGKIVCMLSSVVLNVPPKFLAQYVTVKYALLGVVKALASEYADKGIQINAISPSMIETKFLDDINEKFIELSAHNHPLKRNAKVCDIIPIIKILISGESDYINGINIPITGGSSF